MDNLVEVINSCSLNLTNICSSFVIHIAKRIPLEELLKLQERNDKFVSNIYKNKVDLLL